MPELVHSQLPADLQRRITRIMSDCQSLALVVTRAQIKSAYSEIETARDALSRLLDKADGKDA